MCLIYAPSITWATVGGTKLLGRFGYPNLLLSFLFGHYTLSMRNYRTVPAESLKLSIYREYSNERRTQKSAAPK